MPLSRTRALAIINSDKHPYVQAKATGFGDEIRVAYRRLGRMAGFNVAHIEASAFYTDDPQDALDTAISMNTLRADQERDDCMEVLSQMSA